MTGVLEVGALAAAISAVGSLHTRHERQLSEETVATTLYRKYFGADFTDVAPDRVSVLGVPLPSEIDPHAAACIRAVERYQEDRRKWFLGFSSGSETVGDVRTRVLEELKRWCVTLSQGQGSADEVSNRLEYCWQFLLRPGTFETQNKRSFLQVMAVVCRHLQALLSELSAGRRTGVEMLGKVIRLGRQLVLAMLPMMFLTLPGQQLRPDCGQDVCVRPEDILAAAEGDKCGNTDLDWNSEVGKLLRFILSSPHLRLLCASDEAFAEAGFEVATNTEEEETSLPRTLQAMRSTWSMEQVGDETGLAPPFRGPKHVRTRSIFLETCAEVDRLVFFLVALRPHFHLANTAGDVAMCWLGKCLSHLVQEIEKVLVQLRQSRLELMHATMTHLQELARDGIKNASVAEVSWMQALRHVNETQLETLHCAISAQCTEILAATTLTRETELRSEAQKSLKDVVQAFQNADFQSRCSLALPEGLAEDARQLGMALK